MKYKYTIVATFNESDPSIDLLKSIWRDALAEYADTLREIDGSHIVRAILQSMEHATEEISFASDLENPAEISGVLRCALQFFIDRRTPVYDYVAERYKDQDLPFQIRKLEEVKKRVAAAQKLLESVV